MSWRTVVTSSRWASFGAKSTPGLPPFPDHEDPVELDDDLPSFVQAPRPDPDESEARATPGLPDLRDLGVRVDRGSMEDGAGKPDVLEPDLEAVPARPVDEEARRDRNRQEAVHDPPPEERFPGKRPARVVLVEMDLVRVHRQEGEPHVVRLRHGPPDLSLDLGPDLEVFEKWPVVLQRNSPVRKRPSRHYEACGKAQGHRERGKEGQGQNRPHRGCANRCDRRPTSPMRSRGLPWSPEGRQLSTAITSSPETPYPLEV